MTVWIPNRILLARLARARGFRCEKCKVIPRFPTVDHVKPISLGGTDDMKNIRLLCYNCHKEIHDGFIAPQSKYNNDKQKNMKNQLSFELYVAQSFSISKKMLKRFAIENGHSLFLDEIDPLVNKARLSREGHTSLLNRHIFDQPFSPHKMDRN